MAHDAVDVAKVFAFGRREGIPVTLRAGGTSLNGQAQSDGILVDVRRHFSRVEVLDDGDARARAGRAPCSAASTARSPSTSGASGPTPPRPTSPRSAA